MQITMPGDRLRQWMVDLVPRQGYASSMTGTKLIELSREARRANPIIGMEDAVSVLQVVADPIRWTVLQLLANKPLCVCDIQEHVPIASNLLSYHLKTLREAGLVTSSKRGRWVDYTLADGAMDRLHAALPGANAET